MNEAIGVGKTVEKAIEDALFKLKQTRDNVDIKILETGGLFKKAQVLVTLSQDFLETQAQKQKKQNADKKQNEVSVQTVAESKKESDIKKEVKIEIKSIKEEKETKEKIQDENELEKGKTFLQNFLKKIDIDGEVCASENEEEIFYTITGEKASQLIGYRGESLNSLQFLVSVINGKNNRRNKKVRLDIDGYREKRKETLEMLAKRVAKKVLKTGHQTRLEPMSAYERRIIHTTVQEFEGLTSISKGEEPHRFLIIKKEDEKTTI